MAASIIEQLSQLSLVGAEPTCRWQKATSVYHATNADSETLQTTEKINIIRFSNNEGRKVNRNVSLIGCKMWHRHDGSLANGLRTPTRSPYASQHVVLPLPNVFDSPEDILIPINHYKKCPPTSESEYPPSSGGRTFIEMLYIRNRDLVAANPQMDYASWQALATWRLKNNPFVQVDENSPGEMVLEYKVVQDLWFLLLTPYTVNIPQDAKWDRELRNDGWGPWPREVLNPVALSLLKQMDDLFEN